MKVVIEIEPSMVTTKFVQDGEVIAEKNLQKISPGLWRGNVNEDEFQDLVGDEDVYYAVEEMSGDIDVANALEMV